MKILALNIHLALTVVFCTIGIAHSKPVSFSFTAKVDSMFEHNGETKVNTTVSSSSFAGAIINQNDPINGILTFDTEAPLSPYFQPDPGATGTYKVYQSNLSAPVFEYSIGNNVNLNTTGSAHIQVANNATVFSGHDIFYIESSGGYNPTLFFLARLSLFDNNGLSFDNGGVPSSLKLDSFYYRSFQAGWVRQSDGSQLNVAAQLTSLDLIATSVPEPTTGTLALLSLIMLPALIRKSRCTIATL